MSVNLNDVYDKLDQLEDSVVNKIEKLQETIDQQAKIIDRLESLLDGLDNRL